MIFSAVINFIYKWNDALPSTSNCSLCIYRHTADFCILTWHLAILLNSLIFHKFFRILFIENHVLYKEAQFCVAFLLNMLFFFFAMLCVLWDQGLNPGPGQWECRVLTTGPPGNPLCMHFISLSCVIVWNTISSTVLSNAMGADMHASFLSLGTRV